ncbi:uncharacterized protein LOC134341562 [Mobula hypostoma]|uniref:uncharacterized protein LOC134341562 n=1 Tax=Mobula hypostoma TaxID=723540 RepID=UPI002FC32DB9
MGQLERRLLFHINGDKISHWSEAKMFKQWLKAAGNELTRGKGMCQTITDVLPGMGQQERHFHINGDKISHWSEAKMFNQSLKTAGNQLTRGKAVHLVFAGVGLTAFSTRASSANCSFPFVSSETQRVLNKMDEGKTYVNVKFANTGPQSPSNGGLTSTYSELNFPKDERLIDEFEDPPTSSRPGARPITAQTDGLTSIYSELNFPKNEPVIDEDEDPPIASGPGGMPTNAQTGAHEQESKLKIVNRPYRQICLICIVTFPLIVIVIGLSIHVSQIRQSKFTLDRNYHELNSTLQSKINEMEMKYKSVNETKAKICELLTSRREQAFSQDWFRNEVGCYFISTIERSYAEAKRRCANSDSNLLEINSAEEEFTQKLISDALCEPINVLSMWLTGCLSVCHLKTTLQRLQVASYVVYKKQARNFECIECERAGCKNAQRRFICEKSASLCPDIREKIQDLCQQPVGPT